MKPQSKRDKRAQILYDELQYWGLISYESDMRAVKAIANELPQRMLVRVISKLRRMRGVVDEWLDENGIECEYYDTYGGCEIYANPHDSEQRIRECIKEAGEEDERNLYKAQRLCTKTP